MPSIRDPRTVARRIYVSSAPCLSVPLLSFSSLKTKKAGNPRVPGLSRSLSGSLLRAGPDPILVGEPATRQRRDEAMPLRAQIRRGGRAFARRFAAEICPQEHHAYSPTRRFVDRQAFCRTQIDIQTFPNESITKLFMARAYLRMSSPTSR